MKKYLSTVFMIILLLVCLTTIAQATILSEPIITNPASTVDLWEYSYLNYDPAIVSINYHTQDLNSVSGAIHQGYLTGFSQITNHPTTDFFGNSSSTSNCSRIFTTYIMSSIDQKIGFASGGDDGHSIFIDGAFQDGGAYAVSAIADLDMTANQSYKITAVGHNRYHAFSLWFIGRAADATGGWLPSTHVADMDSISMDAEGFETAPVPEPATMFLLGTGLIGLASTAKRKLRK